MVNSIPLRDCSPRAGRIDHQDVLAGFRPELRVNACVKASAMTTYSSHNKALVVSAIVQLKIGDEVGVFLRDGNLFDLWLRPAQFSGILLSS